MAESIKASSLQARPQERSFLKQSILGYSIGGSASQAQEIQPEDDDEMMDHNNEKDIDADMDEKVEAENQNKL